jgi:hypothetical protein
MNPVIDVLKGADIFEAAVNKKDALAQLTPDKAGELAMQALSAILPQLDVVGEFLPELIAAYKKVSIDEASELDALEVIEEIVHDKGIISFFKRALPGKVEQTLSDSSTSIIAGA